MRSWTLETISWTCSSVNFGVEVLGLGFAPGIRDGASFCAGKVAGIRAKQTQRVSPTNWGGFKFIFAILLAVGRQRQFQFVVSLHRSQILLRIWQTRNWPSSNTHAGRNSGSMSLSRYKSLRAKNRVSAVSTALLERLAPGDRLIVSELSRLGRSLGQVIHIVHELVKRKIRFTVGLPSVFQVERFGPLV